MLGDYLRNVATDELADSAPEMHHRPARAIAQAEAACKAGDHTLVSFPEHVPGLVTWAAS